MRLAVCLTVFYLPLVALAQAWHEGFEQGLGGARSYYSDPPTARLEVATDRPAEGKQFIRAVLPGKRRLEGFSVTAAGLTGARLATVTAQVRGRGEIWLCLISRNGWLYSRQTVPLTDQWQQVSLSKALTAKDTSLGIYFLSREVQTDAVFEVDDVTMSLAAAPKVYDAEVGPWRLEAEDFAQRQAHVAADASASGGKVVRHTQYMSLAGLPCPRTSREVTICLRVNPGFAQEDYRLITAQGGNTQVIRGIKPEKAGQWQWLRFPPVTAGEVGDSFGIDFQRARDVAAPTAIDALVLSTRPDLDAAALDAAPPLFGRHPLALVTRTAQPPVLDGKGDDPCWRNTVACVDFLAMRSLAPAQARTTARLCYDDKNLYLLFVCDEPILDVQMQRRHEFSAKVKERDGEVYQDDSCVVLLDPARTGKNVLDFTVNALGTIADARCPGPDLWETRDVRWNSGAKAAGVIGETLWTVEMAIPFADLCGRAPQPGETWQTCLGRIARARKETTSWNPSNRGFHDPYVLGTLVFGGPGPGIVLTAPASIQLGRNRLAATLTPGGIPSGAYLSCALFTPTTTAHSYEFTELPEKLAAAALPFEIKEGGDLQVAYGVLDAATLQPLYLSPRLSRAAKSSLAVVRLFCDGPYELFLNDEVIGRGAKADIVEIKAPLQKGANVFALRLEKGTAAAQIVAPGGEVVAARWRINAASAPEAVLSRTDDSAWKPAARAGEHPRLGPIIGEPGQAVVLRHTLLWEKTRIWPTPFPALYIARNSNQHITVIVDGLAGRKLENWATCLAVPPEFDILGATGYYAANRDFQPRFVCTQLGEQTLGGRRMRVARIAADKPIVAGRHYIMSLFNVLVRYREQAGLPAKEETSFLYWSEAYGGMVDEPPQVIPVHLLPPLNGRQPKKLVWQLWGSFFSAMDDADMRRATLQTMQAAGMNDMASGDAWTSEFGPKYGIRDTMGVNFDAWSLNMRPYLAEHPRARLLDSNGNRREGGLCTTLLLGSAWPAVEEKLKEKIVKARSHTVDYDHEFSPLNGPHSCYCERCLQAFREYAKLPFDGLRAAPSKAEGLPADLKLDAQTIAEKYGDAWTDFMAWRVAQIFARFKEAAHRLAPGTQFSAYSGYQTPDNPSRYGVDWAHVGRLRACDRVGCGYGRPVEAIPKTLQALNGIPALFGALMTPYDTKELTPQIPITKACLLRLALDATGGVLVYDRMPMDGRTWLAIAETTRLTADFEEAFLHGKRGVLPGCDEAAVQVLRDGAVALVCVMNNGSKAVEYRIPLPVEAGAGTEYYTGAKVAAGEMARCPLPPGESAVYVLRK